MIACRSASVAASAALAAGVAGAAAGATAAVIHGPRQDHRAGMLPQVPGREPLGEKTLPAPRRRGHDDPDANNDHCQPQKPHEPKPFCFFARAMTGEEWSACAAFRRCRAAS